MSRIEEIISQLTDIAKNPKKAMDDFTARKGTGAVGVLPIYAPEEIIYAAGYLPMGLWGAEVSINKASQYLPPFACSIMQTIMELELNGTYSDLKAVLISCPCDTLKAMGQKWKDDKVIAIPYGHAHNRKIKGCIDFQAAEYTTVKERLEKALGVEISNKAINEAIEVYNENRAVMRMFTEVAALHPEIIDPVVRHAVIKARQFMDKAEHTAIVKELIAELMQAPIVPFKGKKIVLTGIMAEPWSFLEVLKEYNIAVVADDLAQESRQWQTDVPAGRNPMVRLAKQWRNMLACSLATDCEKPRVKMVPNLVKAHGADAVIFCQMMFCDPEEYDYPIMLKEFAAQDIPCLKLDIDLSTVAIGQLKTRVQSLVEML